MIIKVLRSKTVVRNLIYALSLIILILLVLIIIKLAGGSQGTSSDSKISSNKMVKKYALTKAEFTKSCISSITMQASTKTPKKRILSNCDCIQTTLLGSDTPLADYWKISSIKQSNGTRSEIDKLMSDPTRNKMLAECLQRKRTKR